MADNTNRNHTRTIERMKASGDLPKEKMHRQRVRYREKGESEFDYAWELNTDKIQLIKDREAIEAIDTYQYHENKKADLAEIDSDISFIDAYIFDYSNDGFHPAAKPKAVHKKPLWHDAILKDVIIPFYSANNRRPKLIEAITIIKDFSENNHQIFFSIGKDNIRGKYNFTFVGITGDITQKAVENVLSSQWKAYQNSL